jgi:alcohol dehydrogenase class IV
MITTGGENTKSSTYASIATIIFIKNKDKISKNTKSVIKATDKLCTDLKLRNNLSSITKYRIIQDLIESNIIESNKVGKNKKLRLSKKVLSVLG